MNAGSGGGNAGAGGSGWEKTRQPFAEIWSQGATVWSAERSEQLFDGIMAKIETRRRRRRVMRVALTCASVGVTLLIGLGLVGVPVNAPFAHLLSRVHAAWSLSSPLS